MTTVTPSWYDQFHCLAGACPDTCCQSWEVPVDPDTAAFYQSLPGEMGEALRAVLVPDGEGEPCLQLRGGKCPMLEEDGLCRLYRVLGEEHLSVICREHPRYVRAYGDYREVGLCASCPECARLVLSADLSLATRETDAPAEGEEPELLPLVLPARGTALRLLKRRDLGLEDRMRGLFLFANELQLTLEEGEIEAVPPLCAFYGSIGSFPPVPEGPDPCQALQNVLAEMQKLETLREDWPGLLRQAAKGLKKGCAPLPPPREEGARAAAYFIYRHWLRGVWDGDVLTWAEFSILATAVATALAPYLGWREAFRRFCLEVEHDEENLCALQDALWGQIPPEEILALTKLF